jgi:hypothetical protein
MGLGGDGIRFDRPDQFDHQFRSIWENGDEPAISRDGAISAISYAQWRGLNQPSLGD